MSIIESFGYYEGACSFPIQRHIDCEMLYVTDGYIKIAAQSIEYTVSKGQMCLIPSGIAHSTYTDDASYKRWVMFINTWDLSTVYSSPLLQNIISGLSCKRPLIADTPAHILDTIRNMHAEYQSKEPLSNDILFAEMIGLISHIARQNPNIARSEITCSQRLVLNIRSYIHQNCSEDLKISDVAAHFFISSWYLSHIFKEQTGISPKTFLISCRITKASRMLTSTELSAAEIAEACGFVSPSDMALRFKKEYGITPTEYRAGKR